MPVHSFTTTLLILTIVVVVLPSGAHAFGAGDIPDFSYLNDKAFRHGDIENVLTELAKLAGGAAAGGGLLGFAKKVMDAGSGGRKFDKQDVKKVYFGNWLRDYSQAMDIAGLSKLSADTLVLIVAVLGFMTFGFATQEFEVTAERLGVYLPVEHIDNPKGYAEKEGDARQFHPKLRPPVEPEELEIDKRTGMKNYMATENRGWDTSTAHIRRTLRACIEHGRRSSGRENADLWEAYRLLGTGLHTLEDLLAHSNWCEIALRKMGHEQVFCHVGDQVVINTPNGSAPPLVTGSFGSADFMHSMMGEATDHISQSSVTDLSAKMNDASNSDSDSIISTLKGLMDKIPSSGSDEKISQAEDMKAKSKAYNFDPDNVAPPEVQKQLFDLLKWRDSVMRDIIEKIEMVPGLSELVENVTEAINPILKQVTDVLGEGSKAVIDTDDQYEVFNDPRASDPSHSLLSKDHFGLILNEPAGKIAQAVVKFTVNNIVQAWQEETEDPDRVLDTILEAFHHPFYSNGRSQIQRVMFETMERWLTDMSDEDRERTLDALTKESVRNGKNKREAGEDETAAPAYGKSGGYGGSSYQKPTGSQQQSGYGNQQQSGYGQQQSSYGVQQQSSHGRRQESQGEGNQYGHQSRRDDDSYGGRPNEEPYSGRGDSYGSRNDNSYERPNENSYARRNEDSYGGRSEASYGGQNEDSSFGRRNEDSYGGRQESSYGRNNEDFSGRRQEEYGRRGEDSYSRPNEEESYGRRAEESSGYGGRSSGREESGYRPSYIQEPEGYGRQEPESEYGQGGGYGGEERVRGGGGFEQEPPRRYGEERSGGYGEQPRGGYGGEGGFGSDETFGAERLNLDEGGGYQEEERREESYERSGRESGGDEYESRY
ncbi:heterokaryon incompatibility protein Het-C-domain-containing protein [Amylostereum chailletii]|nr:heterokaryon incompatibility protein Het-C-domain-containing protein [Amylostereum chailletii]